MGSKKTDLRTAFRDTVEAEFGFLVTDEDFLGPELVHEPWFEMAYHRPDLTVKISSPFSREPAVSTSVRRRDPNGDQRAWLECLYVAAGCGPPQDIGGAAPNRLTTVKRVREHAAALRAVWPSITGPDAVELFRRCPPTRHLPGG